MLFGLIWKTGGDKVEKRTLSEAEPGNRYSVLEIKDEARLINRLSAMGIMQGSEIEICQNHQKQPVLVFARDTLVAIGRQESRKIVIGGLGNA